MMFNTSKCKLMHFWKKKYNNTKCYMSGQLLLTITEEKDLGIVISADVKSSHQSIQAYTQKLAEQVCPK